MSSTRLKFRKHPPAWFTRWYFRHLIARDRCPCAITGRYKLLQKSKVWAWAVYWCARMDDEYERLEHLPFYAWALDQHTSGSSSTVKVSNVTFKRRHG